MLIRSNSFPFIYTHLRSSAAQILRLSGPAETGNPSEKPGDASRRGFTLIEMMVVVLIITLLAAVALPGVSLQMKNHRAKQAAESISMIYRGARLRAMGRGSAVLVRYTGSSNTFQVLEGIRDRDSTVACAQLPEAACVTQKKRWRNGGEYQALKTVSFGSGDYVLTPATAAGGTTDLDLCFSPSGRSYSRAALNGTLNPMVSPITFDLKRTDGVGLKRSVVVTSTGNARTVAYQ